MPRMAGNFIHRQRRYSSGVSVYPFVNWQLVVLTKTSFRSLYLYKDGEFTKSAKSAMGGRVKVDAQIITQTYVLLKPLILPLYPRKF